jgi:formylglycine-generating enzyme required for sulfatase activity
MKLGAFKFLLIAFSLSQIACSPGLKLVKPEMVKVKGGSFLMGDFLQGSDPDATPRHDVKVATFQMMKYEVTYNQYDTLAKKFGWEMPDIQYGRGKNAVSFVNWFEAKRFCECLGMRLPTEQEWEFAARSGGKDEPISGTKDASQFVLYARFERDPLGRTAEVGKKRANGLGLYDMSGNVHEWIGNYYGLYDKSKKDGRKKANFKKSDVRLIRGGSFYNPAPRKPESSDTYTPLTGIFTYKRIAVLGETRDADVGFRCVKRRWWMRF